MLYALLSPFGTVVCSFCTVLPLRPATIGFREIDAGTWKYVQEKSDRSPDTPLSRPAYPVLYGDPLPIAKIDSTSHLIPKSTTMTGIEADVREIKESIRALTEKIDVLLHDRETLAMMKLSEQSLSRFLSEEPDLYTVRDVRTASSAHPP